MVVNYRLPRLDFQDLSPATIILHPPGTIPDPDIYTSSKYNIQPGTITNLGVKATIYNITESFSSLDEKYTKCKVNNDGYNDVKCRMNHSINEAIVKCKSIPWFMTEQSNPRISQPDELHCFDDLMTTSSSDWAQECPQPCILTQYSMQYETTDAKDSGTYRKVRTHYGETFENYMSSNNSLIALEVRNLGYPSQWRGVNLLERTSIIHINFADPYPTIITKDIRATFSDMLGIIGGTFGVFLGLSFVGILDFLISVWNYVTNQI